MTTAEQLAERFSNDGQCWVDADGIEFHEACAELAIFLDCADGNRAHRYGFGDNSVIVQCGDGWDIGFSDTHCWCWADAGHRDECEYMGEVVS